MRVFLKSMWYLGFFIPFNSLQQNEGGREDEAISFESEKRYVLGLLGSLVEIGISTTHSVKECDDHVCN